MTFLKVKNVSLLVFILIIFSGTLIANSVKGEAVIHTVRTRINVFYDNKKQTFTATQNTVEGALDQIGIILSSNDITDPPRNSILNGKEVDVRVVRALPILISDNNQQQLAFSAYTNQFDILKQLKIDIFPEDKVNSELILDPVDENAVGQKIIIDRAPVFSIKVDGDTKIIRSWGKTILDVLKDSKIPLAPKDQVFPNKDSIASNGQTIVITRVSEEDIDIEESIPYKTIYKIDSKLGLYGKKVAQTGVNGKISKKFRVTYKNGVEVSRVLLQSNTVSEVKSEIIYRGALIGIASHVNDGVYKIPMATAFKEAPRGTKLVVTNLKNNKQIVVTVVDSGPYVRGRVVDLSPDAFRALGGTTGLLTNIAVQIIE